MGAMEEHSFLDNLGVALNLTTEDSLLGLEEEAAIDVSLAAIRGCSSRG